MWRRLKLILVTCKEIIGRRKINLNLAEWQPGTGKTNNRLKLS